jgi:hypothetical protein
MQQKLSFFPFIPRQVGVDPSIPMRSHPISQYGESSRRDVQQNRRGGNGLSLSNPHTSDSEMDEDVTAGSIAHVMSLRRCAVVYRWATAEEYFRGGGIAESAPSTWKLYETSRNMTVRW